MDQSAVIDGVYRYHLSRVWDSHERVAFVMLNPSTADAENNDATIRKCIVLAKAWGYSGIEVVNMFAFRSKDPVDLLDGSFSFIGPKNDEWISTTVGRCHRVICAWGANAQRFPQRVEDVVKLVPPNKRFALRLSKEGHPWHPLYIPVKTAPFMWSRS